MLALSKEYGIGRASMWRHARLHLPKTIAQAETEKSIAKARDLRSRVEAQVNTLEGMVDECKGGNLNHLITCIRELRAYHELLGKVTGEIANEKIQAFFMWAGVKNEDELKARLEASKVGEEMEPLEAWELGMEAIEKACSLMPSLLEQSVQRLRRLSYAELEPARANGQDPISLPDTDT